MTTACRHGNYLVEEVSFESARLRLAGLLHVPEHASGPLPAAVILGPFASVKEHAPAQYATRLADEGYVALAFDAAYVGESAGEPRGLNEPLRRAADVRAAIDWILARPEVDRSRLALVGLGDGASEVVVVASEDERVGALAAVSGVYRDPESDRQLAGDCPDAASPGTGPSPESRLDARAARAKAASARFAELGEVDYLPVVDPVRADVALPGREPWRWYLSQTGRGLWENRYAVMGDVAYLEFESLSAARLVRSPVAILHGGRASDGAAARRHFDAVAGTRKELFVEPDASRYQYYDDPSTVDRAVRTLASWFGAQLA